MIVFENPPLVWLAAGWLVLVWLFGRVQRRALAWLETHVAPRFRGRLTRYDRRKLGGHLVLLALAGAALAVAAAGPARRGEAEGREESGRVLLLVDASASMFASDLDGPVTASGETPQSRLAAARQIALELAAELAGWRFALASFSGQNAVHLPMVRDPELLAQALGTLENHGFYRNTGSSFARALELVAHFVERGEPALQVVLLSDGEQPYPEPYERPLEVLAAQQVPIHAVAIGSVQGQSRVIWDFSDIVNQVEKPRALREYTTRRVDVHLRQMARDTGGHFAVAAPGVAAEIAASLRSAQRRAGVIELEELTSDLAAWPLALFLALFLLDQLVLWRRPAPAAAFDLEKLGPPRRRAAARSAPAGPAGPSRRGATGRGARPAGGRAAALALVALAPWLLSCGSSPRDLAHRENELGIAFDAARRHAAARTHYELAAGLDVEPQIPTYNLARSLTLAGDYSEAHDVYQEALTLDPELVEAHYNDGATLYRWGVAERDPRNCELERTENLWSSARRRFVTAAAMASEGSDLDRRAHANLRHVDRELALVRDLMRNPPAHCLPPPPQPQPQGGGGEAQEPQAGQDEQDERQGDGGGSGGGDRGEPSGDGGDQDPQQGGDGGDDQDPQQGGGGGGSGDQDQQQGGGGGGGGQQDEQQGAGGGGGGGQDPQQGGGGGGGGDQDPQQGGGGGGGSGGGLSADDLAAIQQELARIDEQLGEEGKYHRRTVPEQFPRSAWEDPDDMIWW